MNVNCFSLIKGAKKVKGLTVIADVFRASNTIAMALRQGAECLIPVYEIEDALKLREENPGFLLFGERDGLPIEGFDYGNSPSKTEKLDLTGKEIVISTSAGTKCLINAIGHSDEVIIAAFLNADAVVDYIKKKNPEDVSLVAAGLKGVELALEDELCAAYIKMKLLGLKPDFENMKTQILKCKGADRLRGHGFFDDLDFCLQLNYTGIVPKLVEKSGVFKLVKADF